MAQAFAKIYLHVIFSTKGRARYILLKFEKELYSYLVSLCRKEGAFVHQIGGIEDHVHILLEPARTVAIMKQLQSIKANSSRWMKTCPGCSDFSWQGGDGIFSVSPSNLDKVKRYIANQKQHHKNCSFKEEFVGLLNHANMTYDEKYLWD